MGPSKILAAAKALPAHSRTTDEILPFIDSWLEGSDKRTRDKVHRLFRYAQVDRRYSIMSPEEVFTSGTFAEKNDIFIERMTDLAEEALLKAIEKAAIDAGNIDYIITTSCTGIMIPSVDAHLINRLRLRQDIVRMPITEMGCAAGVSALIYAHEMLRHQPDKTVAIIAMESPTATLQHGDLSMTNMVSAAIFGDGVSCTILGPGEDKVLPVIKDTGMFHFYDELRMMGFDLVDTGLKIVLDPAVPDKIKENFDDILIPFLSRNNLQLSDIEHFIFHPGGKKIIEMVESLLRDRGKNIDITRDVLRRYGNMSSATVLYVLEEYLDKDISSGEKGLMLSFGPGFSAQRILLEWQ
jgi:alkylresorcinol/alkylpyrone synthase